MDPVYPVGTPEYETYVGELRVELGKFARGEEPYPYRREELSMPTVPNWIAKGYAYSPARSERFPARAYQVKTWRATPTQAVVTLRGAPGEFRFRLDDLRYAIRSHKALQGMILIPPDDERLAEVAEREVRRSAVNGMLIVIADTPLDPNTMDAEALVVAIGSIQRAATKALADLADLL